MFTRLHEDPMLLIKQNEKRVRTVLTPSFFIHLFIDLLIHFYSTLFMKQNEKRVRTVLYIHI